MKTEQLQLVFEYLDKIAQKIGTTAEQLWPVLIRQQYVDAVVSAVCLLALLFITGVVLRYALKQWGEDGRIYKDNTDELWGWVLIFLGCLLITALIYFLISFPDIFNPEYWALKDLMRMVK